MAKTNVKQVKTASGNVSRKLNYKEDPGNFAKYENYIYIGIIIFAVLMFFKDGVFSGKVFATSDILASESFKTFLADAKSAGVFPLWVPNIFMGMPNFPIIAYNPRVYDFFYYLWDSVYGVTTNSGTNSVLPIVLYYAVFGIGFYMYSNYKFKNKLVALYCALSATFATDYIQRIVVGHNTKVMALAFFPFILLILDKLIDSLDDDKSRCLDFQI